MNGLLLVFSLGFPARGDQWFAADKLKHFLATNAVQTAHYSMLRVAGVEKREALMGAAVLTMGVGLAKELRDARGASGFSWKDLAWDAAGTGTATLLLHRLPDR